MSKTKDFTYAFGWVKEQPDFRDSYYTLTFGRILPQKVDLRPMLPEVYDQGSIGCHDAETEVLTEGGWTKWPEYKGECALGTVNPEDHSLEFQLPTALHRCPYKGQMISANRANLDFRLTPNHRMYVRKWIERDRTLSPTFSFQEAGSMGWYCGMLPSPSGFVGTELKNVAVERGLEFTGDDFLAMVALVISCGWVGGSESTWDRVSFCCFRPDRIESVRALASRVGFFEYPYRPGVFERGHLSLASWFRANVFAESGLRASSKRVPSIVKVACSRQISHFLEFFGDQHVGINRQFYSSSATMIDDLQELLLRAGKRSGIYSRDAREAVMRDGRVVRPADGSKEFILTEWEKETLSFQKKKDIEVSDYDGEVFCASVPNGILITRRNGRVLISGNSCGPQTLAALIEFNERKQGFTDAQTPSRLFLYYTTRELMGTVNQDSGVTNREMLKALANKGYCEETHWDYRVNQFRQRPPVPAFDDAKKSLVDKYEKVPQTLDTMRGCLADGFPFIFGFTVYNSIDQAAQTGDILYPRQSDRPVGGHDVLIYGYDDASKRFLLRNSWGRGWGNDGYGTISYDYATHPNLSSDFWTVHFVPRDDEGPGPPPPPNPDGGSIVEFFTKYILPLIMRLLEEWLKGDKVAAEATFAALQSKVEGNRDTLKADWSQIKSFLKLILPWLVKMIESWINSKPNVATAEFKKMQAKVKG